MEVTREADSETKTTLHDTTSTQLSLEERFRRLNDGTTPALRPPLDAANYSSLPVTTARDSETVRITSNQHVPQQSSLDMTGVVSSGISIIVGVDHQPPDLSNPQRCDATSPISSQAHIEFFQEQNADHSSTLPSLASSKYASLYPQLATSTTPAPPLVAAFDTETSKLDYHSDLWVAEPSGENATSAPISSSTVTVTASTTNTTTTAMASSTSSPTSISSTTQSRAEWSQQQEIYRDNTGLLYRDMTQSLDKTSQEISTTLHRLEVTKAFDETMMSVPQGATLIPPLESDRVCTFYHGLSIPCQPLSLYLPLFLSQFHHDFI